MLIPAGDIRFVSAAARCVMETVQLPYSELSSVARQVLPGLAAIVFLLGTFGIPRFMASASPVEPTVAEVIPAERFRPASVVATSPAISSTPSVSTPQDVQSVPVQTTPVGTDASAQVQPASPATIPAQSAPPTATPVPPTPSPTPTPQIDGLQGPVPYRTQFDGTAYEGSNCGVAAIAMVMEYYGRQITTQDLRYTINTMTGDWNSDSGLDWRHMKQAVEQQGLPISGLHNADGSFHTWTMDDLLAEARQGRPVIVLARYQALPGHENAVWYGDHYIVFLGMTADGRVVYHDPAFRLEEGETGAYRITDQATFERAWSQTWIGQNRTAMAVTAP